jgi:UDP-N-acetylmuramoyl-tripeptide--D-alanyl-D-alanine ligase
MQESCAARVVTCGLEPGATVTAEDVDAVWPAPLSFTLRYDGTAVRVRTSLYGRHWVHVVLAAIATGVEAGVPLDEAARAVATVRSFGGRMQPVISPNGVTFIRDDIKAGLLSALPALDFLEEARAPRKIVVFGRITNFEGDPYEVYAALAARALEVADEVIFTGPDARYAPDAKNGGRLCRIPTVEAAAKYLRQTTRRGDLVLLKGSRRSHMQRITLAYSREVRCWLAECGRKRTCEGCELIDLPSDPDSPLPARLLRGRQQTLETP